MTTPRQRIVIGVLVVLAAIGGLLRLQPVLPRRAGAVLRVGRRALPVRLGRHRSRSRACRTGSGSCCRASFPEYLPGPGGYASIGILGA